MKLNKKKLITLCEFPAVYGKEEHIAKVIKKEITKNGLKLETDNLGSVWGVKESTNKKAKTILIDAHMDEVGFLVTKLNKNGLISFEVQGGIWKDSLNSQRLRVWSPDISKSYSGVVAFPDANTHKGTGKTPEIEDMFLDIGAQNDKELLKMGLKQGSMITFDTKTEFNGNRVVTKAADNRVGASMIVEIMNYIKDKEFDYNIVVGCTVREEGGLIGARTSAYKFNPDLAMVIDVSPARDIPVKQLPNGVLGEGTMLRHKDAATIYSPKIIDYLASIIKKNKLKYQDYFSLGGTNAGSIHISNEGIKVIPIGIVARNLHTGSTVFDINDYNETLKLIEFILRDISSNKIVKLN